MGWIQCTNRQPQADDVWISCDRCNGGGSDFSLERLPTDRAHLAGETPQMAWNGYRPTNICTQCGGEGGTWLPKSKNKSRLNIAYATAENRDRGFAWVGAFLQTWMADRQQWHPPVADSIFSERVWLYESDTDADQWEGAR